MTSITFERRRDTGEISSFSFRGHANFAKKGDDIVCAALSVLVINTVNALDTLCKADPLVSSDEEKGEIICQLKNTQGEKEQLLAEALLLGAKSVEQEYGKQFCTVTVREV